MVRDNFEDAEKAADGVLAGSSLPGRLVLETVGMYELPLLPLSWMAEELHNFTKSSSVFLWCSSMCPLVTLPLSTSATWMSSESSTNPLQRLGSK